MTDRTFHIVGPPGTGKTGHLSNYAENAVAARGSMSVVIMSLTKAAAREIANRTSGVAEGNVGTLHAHCFHALGEPEIAETQVEEWNKDAGSYMTLTNTKKSVDGESDFTESATDGDKLLSAMNIYRSNMTPAEEWTEPLVHEFYLKWTEWKENNDLLDFTDMIETCLRDVDQHPSKPSVMLGDEAQDWSKLEATLFREKWGQHADTVLMAGDEDQSLYVWRGSDPHIFSGHPIPKENIRILEKSYRVPRAVHAKAQSWIRQITDRTDVVYHPRDYEGEVTIDDGIQYKYADDLVDRIADNDGTSMILCSCGYMVNFICNSLRASGIPFHNPYRTRNRGWNPLASRKNTTSSSDRLYAYLYPDNDSQDQSNMDRWSKESMKLWVPLLGGTFTSGVKKMVEAGHFIPPRTGSEWCQLFKKEEDILPCLKLDLDWFQQKIIESKSKVMSYPIQIARIRGKEMLGTQPRIIVGTIHSVKGGEADHVYVFPDISYQAAKDADSQDSIIRMFYVAFTRARETLTLCGPSTKFAVEW